MDDSECMPLRWRYTSRRRPFHQTFDDVAVVIRRSRRGGPRLGSRRAAQYDAGSALGWLNLGGRLARLRSVADGLGDALIAASRYEADPGVEVEQGQFSMRC